MIRALLFFAALVISSAGFAQTVPLGLQPAPEGKFGSVPEAKPPLLGMALPSSHDLSDKMPPPGNQGRQQSCVGWATAYALKTFHEKVENNWSVLDQQGGLVSSRVFSPSFVYNQINGGQDQGSNFGDAFRVLAQQGAAPLSAMPYTANPFVPVPASAKNAAAPFKIDTFRRIDPNNDNNLKAQLVAGFPVVIGSRIYSDFAELPNGAVWSRAAGQYLGLHAMVVVGYDDNRRAYKVINSWGKNWSSNGYGWISYELFRLVVSEAYIVVDLKGPAVNDTGPDPAELPSDVWVAPEIAPSRSQISVAPFCNTPFCQNDASFSRHNVQNPTTGEIGMYVTGMMSIPAGVRGTAQIVIPVEFANGAPVLALTPQFGLPSGQAAFGTPPVNLTGTGVNTTWFAFVPYCALGVQKNVVCRPFPPPFGTVPFQSNLRAKPVLFIDQFGVAEGGHFPFFVRL